MCIEIFCFSFHLCAVLKINYLCIAHPILKNYESSTKPRVLINL